METIISLQKLNISKQRAFNYLMCARLLPYYQEFSTKYKFGDSKELLRAVNYCYEHIFMEIVNRSEVKKLLYKLEQNIPDTEDFSSILASSALDACTVVGESLDFLLDSEFERVQTVSLCGIETAVRQAQEANNFNVNNVEYFKELESTPIVKKERKIQTGIVSFLNKIERFELEDIKTLLLLQAESSD